MLFINMGTNCAPLIADFYFAQRRDFMPSLSDDKEAEIIQAYNSTSRYLDDLLNIDKPCFEGMVGRICPPGLQLNEANASDIPKPHFRIDIYLFQMDLEWSGGAMVLGKRPVPVLLHTKPCARVHDLMCRQ